MKKHLLVLFAFLATGVTLAQNKTWFKPSDTYNIPSLSDPNLSPDGKWVAYNLSVIDTAKDKSVSRLYMQSWDGKESIELTHGPDPASSPRWSPDGHYLSYLSAAESKNGSQVWLMDRRGGAGMKLTEIKGDLGDYSWSPDSKKLLLVITDPENKGKEEPKTPKPIQIDRYHFKQDGRGYLQHLHTHLYLFDIASKKLDTLTKGNYDESRPVWSPDGTTIAYVSNTTADPDKNSNLDIYTIEAKHGGTIKQLTTWAGSDASPKWSPDSKQIAYLRSTADAPYLMYDQSILCLMNADGSDNKLITTVMDRPVSDPNWSADGKSILFTVTDDRSVYIAQYGLDSKKISTVNKGKYVFTDIATNTSGNCVVQMSTPYLPGELYALEKGALRRLTFQQDAWMKNIKFAHVEGFQSKSKDGTQVSGIVYMQDSTHSKKLPFVLFIHGGPVGQDAYSFDATRQVLACAGYAVAGVNYRGSSGRGLAYCKAIFADWGNKEVKDLLGAVDELVKQGIADPDHLGIGGWSYGAISTNYTVATDTRFKAGISGAGSSLQMTMYGSDQYVLQYENELGVPWKNAEKWMKLSYPFFHADRIKTPMLFMSGLKDFNVPTAGSEQMYEALKSIGLPTEMVLYPNQSHGISVPSYQVDRLQRYIAWYDKYLK